MFCWNALLHVGEIRSLFPEGTRCLALTATASKTLRRKVSFTIGLYRPLVIAISPCKRNLIYTVGTKFVSIEKTFKPLLEQLRREWSVSLYSYCRRHQDVSNLYRYFKHGLGIDFTEAATRCSWPLKIQACGDVHKVHRWWSESSNCEIIWYAVTFEDGVRNCGIWHGPWLSWCVCIWVLLIT